MLASVIIPTYNRAEQLKQTLGALSRQTIAQGSFEVIVIDDGSTDETEQMLQSVVATSALPLRIIRSARCGAGIARNKGLAQAVGEFVLFTDSDCEPSQDWVLRMVEALRQGPSVVGGKVAVPDDCRAAAVCVNYIMQSWLGGMGRRWRLLGLIPGYRVRTGNMGVVRSLIAEAGGFDGECGFYGEDAVLSERLLESGSAATHCDSAVVVHHEDRSGWDYLGEAFAKGNTTARFVTRGLLRMRLLYLLPILLLVVVLALCVSPGHYAAHWLWGLISLYGLSLLGFGVHFAWSEHRWAFVGALAVWAVLLHLVWALGWVSGLVLQAAPQKGVRSPRFWSRLQSRA